MPSKIRKVIEELFRVYNKEGELVDFKLNDIQIEIDENIIAPIEACEEAGYEAPPELLIKLRSSILKYRQGGVSTLVLAWFLIKCMQRYACCVMLTHDKEHSEKLLYRARIMLKNLKGAKPKTSKLNDNEIAFEKTNSLFYIGTAGSKEFGRSATITHLHCSEIAFWKNPAHLMKSLFQAVPKKSGVIIHETTANGWGNWYQKSFYNYRAGKGGFSAFFFPWYIESTYFSTTPYIPQHVDLAERKTEWSLYRRIARAIPSLTKEEIIQKLQWRREKIDENQGDQTRQAAIRSFNQEYPSTTEEAFTHSGGSLFPDIRARETNLWRNMGPNAYSLHPHPINGNHYAFGADFAGGTGNDSSALVGFCVETHEQVYRFEDNYINPIDFTHKVVEVCKAFNMAFIVPEVNAHGLAGVSLLKKLYPTNLIYKHAPPKGFTNAGNNIQSHGYGWRTSGTSKPYMVGIAQQFFYNGWIIYDPLTEDQLRSFTEDPDTKKMEADGGHDDIAIAVFLAFIGVLRLYKMVAFDPDTIGDQVLVVVAKLLEKTTEEVKPKMSCTWRDTTGSLMIPFKEMFGRKPRSGHV